ncbi:MAG TPA: zinc-binding alcohol dehydrogenase family protein [Terriglobia bacterium]|nr:zinc-binding alcohol dehydrogenase family protein [Terriglobia bacterium]
MKAAVLHKFGETPVYEDFPDPVPTEGQLLVDVVAAPLENIDRVQVSGRHFSSKSAYPKLPAIIGSDGVGLIDGKTMTFGGCVTPYGAMAEKSIVPKGYASFFMELADSLDPALAAAVPSSTLASLLPLKFGAKLQPGENVLIQGATGFAGRLALQVAQKLGAGRVVCTGRDPASLEALAGLGADAVIDLKQPESKIMAAFRREAGDSGYDVILDFVWGRPTDILLSTFVPEALGLSAKSVRLVQIGESGGPAISLTGESLRTSGLVIMGANAGIVAEEVPELAAQVFDWITNGELSAEVERVSLKEIGKVWKRQMHGKRLVVMPDPDVRGRRSGQRSSRKSIVAEATVAPPSVPTDAQHPLPRSPSGVPGSMIAIDGEWKLKPKSLIYRKMELDLEISSSGQTFSGTVQGGFLPASADFADGRIEGRSMSWSVTVVMQVEIRILFTATLEGDALVGKLDAGRFGKIAFTGVRA